MAFTDNSNIYASFHEEGFNRIVDHVRRQRPSLFNYATAQIAANPELLCRAINPHPIIGIRLNPLVTIVDLLPVPGTDYGLNFAVQLVELRIDFHPGDEFNLPAELSPPLGEQRLAIALKICGGLACPSRELIDKLIPPPDPPRDKQDKPEDERPKRELTPLPVRELMCFCLDAFAVGGIRIRHFYGKPYLEPFIEGLEIVDIEPKGLENSIECYVETILKLSVLPGLRMLLEVAPLKLMEGVNVVLKPTPTSSSVPNNPAIEHDELRAYIDVEVV